MGSGLIALLTCTVAVSQKSYRVPNKYRFSTLGIPDRQPDEICTEPSGHAAVRWSLTQVEKQVLHVAGCR